MNSDSHKDTALTLGNVLRQWFSYQEAFYPFLHETFPVTVFASQRKLTSIMSSQKLLYCHALVGYHKTQAHDNNTATFEKQFKIQLKFHS